MAMVWMTINGYGSIPIHTIFRGMTIHISQLFCCEPKDTEGVQGLDLACHVLPATGAHSVGLPQGATAG